MAAQGCAADSLLRCCWAGSKGQDGLKASFFPRSIFCVLAAFPVSVTLACLGAE
jgi:hypothetical protein